MRIVLTTAVALALLIGAARAADATPVGPNDLPNPAVTPGAIRLGVTAADLCPIAHTPAFCAGCWMSLSGITATGH